ncbi:hypothetical protein KIL84_000235 [Mauremys mutica]|uniref:Uncharacterized protein n=1 Tax=Mauremys mutica TaxID=74926 RepID=A0A9D4B380_9SAUR|nr:hypothetical protein KIL84_000235 [Mauremys mutica]
MGQEGLSEHSGHGTSQSWSSDIGLRPAGQESRAGTLCNSCWFKPFVLEETGAPADECVRAQPLRQACALYVLPLHPGPCRVAAFKGAGCRHRALSIGSREVATRSLAGSAPGMDPRFLT